MPNQRDPDKKELRAWVHQNDLKKIKELAKQEGIPVNQLVMKMLNNYEKNAQQTPRR